MSLFSLNRQRGVYKTKITKLRKFLDEDEISTYNPDEAEVILQDKLESVSEIKCSLKDLIHAYVQLPEDTDLKDNLELTEDLSDQIQDIQVRFKILLNKNDTKTKSIIGNKTDTNFKIKIPDLPLPYFSGSYEDFPNFKKQFMSIIGENIDISDTQRLCYLKGCLRGDAKLLESAQDTFESLFASLEERYENKRAVIDVHICNLINLSKIPESPSQIMHLIDSIKRNLRALNLLNLQRNDLSDAMLLNILFQKLDPEIRRGFELKLQKKEIPKLDNFFSYLEERSRVLSNLNANKQKR